MGFIDNIREFFDVAELPEEQSFRAIMFGWSAVYLEGVKRIISYQKDQVVLGIKRGNVTVHGADLYIKKFCMGDVVVCGKITGMEKSGEKS